MSNLTAIISYLFNYFAFSVGQLDLKWIAVKNLITTLTLISATSQILITIAVSLRANSSLEC